MARSVFRLLSVAMVVVLAACTDDPNAPALPAGPDAVLVTAGNDHFFFQAPLGAGGSNGEFNPRLTPVVEVCRLATTSQPELATPCAEMVVTFETGPGGRDVAVQIDTRRENYFVTWNLASFTLATGYYRVTVRSAPSTGANTLLGIADVAVAPNRAVARSMAGPGVLPATTTQTIPVKFRIEEGALCEVDTDCFEGTVGPDGGTFITDEEQAGALFPEGALDGTRTLIIERVGADDVPYCVPTHNPQYEGCYRYRLEPALAPGETFPVEVVVGVCLDPAAMAFDDELELQKWDEVDPASLTSLPRREVDFLECEGFEEVASSGFLSRVARAGGRLLTPIASFIAPAPLHAGGVSPYGGGLNDFSRMGWVRPLEIEVSSGDAQTTCVNHALGSDPTVQVSALLTGTPLSGVPITFVPTAGGGSASPADASTDGSGLASTGWTLGGTPGANTLLVQGLNPLSGWPQWTDAPPVWGSLSMSATAESTALAAAFLYPLGPTFGGSAGHVSGLHPTIELCELDAGGDCVGPVTTFGGFVEYPDLNFYRLRWTPPALDPSKLYRVTAIANGERMGSVTVTTVRSAAVNGVMMLPAHGAFALKLDITRSAWCGTTNEDVQ